MLIKGPKTQHIKNRGKESSTKLDQEIIGTSQLGKVEVTGEI